VVAKTLSGLSIAIRDGKEGIVVEWMPIIIADESQLQHVMQNLISDSLKFHGLERPMIHISARERITEWTFSVMDNGMGLNVD
jgi:light-regulated signal transduction histidine kinase (bacteriophytochrome)